MSGKLRVDQLYAFVIDDENGDEGLMAILRGDKWMPLVGADVRRMKVMEPYAQGIANQMGRTVRVLLFEKRREVKTIEPEQSGTGGGADEAS